MTLQSEVGDLRRPMRPLVAYLESEDAHSLVNDPSPVTWTAATSQVDCVVTAKAMDEGFTLAVDATSKNIVLPPGQWEVLYFPTIDEAGAAPAVFRLAITNSAGTTIYAESGDIDVPASSSVQHLLTAYIHVTDDAGQQVALRAAGSTANLDIATGSQLAIVRKIGNRNETGQ